MLQASQARLIGVEPLADMNPVLLKPLGEGYSNLVMKEVEAEKIISRENLLSKKLIR
ncbi:MAG: hypothetical protein MZU97_01595 [Bacillus subtilis]|nr:hypothetical protein [Bacillus subtilis]